MRIVGATSPASGTTWWVVGATFLVAVVLGLALLGSDDRKAAVAGLLAAASGVAVGELVGGILTSAGSPVVAVGSFSIDNVPPGAKDFAIETFGTNDKRALIIGTLVILALIGMALGPLARRAPKVAATIVAVVSLVGVLATADQMDVGLLVALWPSLLGGAAAVGTLLFLLHPPAALAFGGDADDAVAPGATPVPGPTSRPTRTTSTPTRSWPPPPTSATRCRPAASS